MLSWHQMNAIRREHRTRHLKAHIYGNGMRSLCGRLNFTVYVEERHAHNEHNNVCKKCLQKLLSNQEN